MVFHNCNDSVHFLFFCILDVIEIFQLNLSPIDELLDFTYLFNSASFLIRHMHTDSAIQNNVEPVTIAT